MMLKQTCFFCSDSENVAGFTHPNAVDGEHAKVVGLGWTQIHQSHVSQ